MKTYILLFVLLTGFLTACQNTTPTSKKADSVITAENKTVSKLEKECYLYASGKDTIAMTLRKNGDQLSGDLLYSLFEKDRNYGTITGKMKGDSLFIHYIFDAEGMHSARELIFLKKGNQLLEGFGDVQEKNGEMVFKDPRKIQFNNSIVLQKGNCK
eukprot:gene14348-17433_t